VQSSSQIITTNKSTPSYGVNEEPISSLVSYSRQYCTVCSILNIHPSNCFETVGDRITAMASRQKNFTPATCKGSSLGHLQGMWPNLKMTSRKIVQLNKKNWAGSILNIYFVHTCSTSAKVLCCLMLTHDGISISGNYLWRRIIMRMFPFWILPELTMMQVVVTIGAIRRGQSNHR